jgi:ABC-2 type transport system permease protein
MIIFYGMRFFFSIGAILFQRAENLQYMWYHLYRLGMRPDNIYQPWLKYLILSAIPVGMIASVPARIALGIASPLYAFACAGMAIFILFCTHLAWNWALKKYSSASS